MLHWHCLILAEVLRCIMVPPVGTAAVGDSIGHKLLLSVMSIDGVGINFRPVCNCHLLAARIFCLVLSGSNGNIDMQELYQYLGARQWLRCKNTLVQWAGGLTAMRWPSLTRSYRACRSEATMTPIVYRTCLRHMYYNTVLHSSIQPWLATTFVRPA